MSNIFIDHEAKCSEDSEESREEVDPSLPSMKSFINDEEECSEEEEVEECKLELNNGSIEIRAIIRIQLG
jgi:hypothetical protein